MLEKGELHLNSESMEFPFLNPEELRALSGYRQKGAQVKWLNQNGIPFIVNRLGNPVVSRVGIMEQLSPQRGRPASPDSPDLEALRNLDNGSKKAH